jgi:putative sterol carrier protein
MGRRIAHLNDRVLRARRLPIVEDVPTQLVWDEDVALAVECGLLSDVRGAFNIAAANALPISEIARLVEFKVLNVPSGLARAVLGAGKMFQRGDPDRLAGWMQAGTVAIEMSSQRAIDELGWKPRYPTVADVAIALSRELSEGADPRIRLYLGMVRRMARRAIERGEIPRDAQLLELKIHLDVTGRRGGDFRIELERGHVSIHRGIPRPPDAVIQVSADTLLGLLSGTGDPSTARMTGKVRLRGEPTAAFVFDAMVSGFRQSAEKPGARGKVARGLSRWFAPRSSR